MEGTTWANIRFQFSTRTTPLSAAFDNAQQLAFTNGALKAKDKLLIAMAIDLKHVFSRPRAGWSHLKEDK